MCGKAEAEEGKTLCPACKIACGERQKQYYHNLPLKRKQEIAVRNKAVRAERIAAGLCISCGEPVFKGLFCEKHYYARRESDRKFKAKKRAEKCAEKKQKEDG